MKTFTLTLLLSAAALAASAQKLNKEEVDKFNGSKTLSTTREGLVVTMGYSQVSTEGYHYIGKDSAEAYGLFFILKPSFTGSLKEGNSVTLLTEKGESLEMTYSGKYDLFTAGQSVVFACAPTKEQLEILSQTNVTAVRFEMSSRLDYDIKKNKQAVLSNISKLLLSSR